MIYCLLLRKVLTVQGVTEPEHHHLLITPNSSNRDRVSFSSCGTGSSLDHNVGNSWLVKVCDYFTSTTGQTPTTILILIHMLIVFVSLLNELLSHLSRKLINANPHFKLQNAMPVFQTNSPKQKGKTKYTLTVPLLQVMSLSKLSSFTVRRISYQK